MLRSGHTILQDYIQILASTGCAEHYDDDDGIYRRLEAKFDLCVLKALLWKL